MNSNNPSVLDLSIVIPVYNEEQSVEHLYTAIVKALEPQGLNYEIIFVDDGSTDDTFAAALRFANADPALRIIKLNRNYGQATALSAGIDHAQGEYIVTMDGDLQNDPEDIARLLSKIREGYDIVLGWREKRKDALLSRKIPSKIANALIRAVTGTKIKDVGCAIRISRSEVMKQFHIYADMHRYLPVISAMAGAKIAEIEVKHHYRKFGHSKYGLSRIYKVLLDLVGLKTIWAGFHLPLFGFGVGGVVFAFLSLAVFLTGMLRLLLNPGQSIIILMGVSMLLGSLSLFLIILGFVCDMTYQTSSLKIEDILKTTKGVEVINNESEIT